MRSEDDLPERQTAEDKLRLERLKDAVRIGEDALQRGDFEQIEPDDLARYLSTLGETGSHSGA